MAGQSARISDCRLSGETMRNQSRIRTRVTILAAVTIGLAFLVVGNVSRSHAAPPQSQTASSKAIHTDDFQRSARLDTYKVIADSGAGRGENIYFYKCWMCHNQYAKTGPYLKELFKHLQLMSGDPVTDENVAAKIKEGGPGMPAFGTTLKDADVADLITYIKEGKCCVEGENPPDRIPGIARPRNKWPVQSGLSGGATGAVKIPSGDSPEGIGVQLIAPNGVRTTVYTDAQGTLRISQDANRRLHAADSHAAALQALRHEFRRTSTARPSWTISFWSGFPIPTPCRPRRKLNASSAARNCSGTCRARRRRKRRFRKIVPPAIPGSRFSATGMTNTAGD